MFLYKPGRSTRIAWLVGAFSPLLGCGNNAPPLDCNAVANPTAAIVQAQIFTPTCALSSSCHSSTGAKAGLDLSSVVASCQGLIATSCEFPTRQRAVSGNGSMSFVVEKLTCPTENCSGTSQCPGESDNMRMPKDNPPLPQCYIDAVSRWIDQGLPGC